jgi:hypothetical protein
MASKTKKGFLKRNISLAQQIIAMEKLYPTFQSTWKMNTVTWTGTIQPTPMSSIYTVQVKYSLNMPQPNISVLTPELVVRKDAKTIPHVYPGNLLCLFRPKKKEWTKEMFIAETIMPWISLWLYHYEIWHATGEWLGGGEHFRSGKRRKKIV